MYATGTSNLAQWETILWAIESSRWPHERVLDVGAGWGKAAILLREYLNVKPVVIDALEADVLAWSLRAGLYDHTWHGRVQAFPTDRSGGGDPTLSWSAYDTVLMADVIEHMPMDEALAVIGRIPGQIVVSTPLVADVAQHAVDPDIPDLERHVSQWELRGFYALGRCEQHWIRHGQLIVRLGPTEQGGQA